MRELNPSSLDDMKGAADHFKVTPSAVTVRAMRLGQINGEAARAYLEQLRDEFERLPKRKGSNPIKPENAVRKYAGRELTRRMLNALDSGSITPREFCRAVCLNKLQPSQLLDLRKAIR
jgi:flagellar motor switch protein FliG